MSILDDIVDYLNDSRQYETYISCRCMFHTDNRPSMLIHEDYYKCLSCGKSGRTDHLLSTLKGLPIKPKTKPDFRNPFNKWIRDFDSLEKALKIAYKTLKNNRSMGNYLIKKRGIFDETISSLRIGWIDGWFTFPVIKDNKIIGAVARAGESIETDAKYILPSGQSSDILYVPSFKLLEKAPQIYCVFGIIDAVTLYQLDVPCFSTMTGKRLNPKALDQFRKRIIFIPDKGEESDAMKIIKDLGWRGVLAKPDWSDDCKDINDVWTKHPERLRLQWQHLGKTIQK